MAEDRRPRQRILHDLTSIGGRAAAVTMRPLNGAVGAAAGAGIELERRAVDRLLANGDLERLLSSPQLQTIMERLLRSDGMRQVINTFFDSGLFDLLIERAAASEALGRLVDEVVQNPSVLAAVSQQGLGFADQLGEQVRVRSRKADRRLEQLASRRANRPAASSADRATS